MSIPDKPKKTFETDDFDIMALTAKILVIFAVCALVAFMMTACTSRPAGTGQITLYTYSPEFQRKAADQLDRVRPDNPELATLVDDYGRTRKAIRASQ